MSEVDQQQLSEWCERIYSRDGQSAVIDYILEHHDEQPWGYCEPCEANSPITTEKEPVCLVCGSLV